MSIFNESNMFDQTLDEHMNCFRALKALREPIATAGDMITRSLAAGKKILICGNGGSAADAQHFAAEIVGRFTRKRKAWPALALTTDTSVITAVANDYAYDHIFSRQVEALGQPDDILIGISTSGNSENVARAMRQAQKNKMKTIALAGNSGGTLVEQADASITIPSAVTARIQEAHIFILHFWANTAEIALAGREESP